MAAPGDTESIPSTESESVRPGLTNHMLLHKTSNQQRRAAACLPHSRRRMPALPLPHGDYGAHDDGTGRSGLGSARSVVNETRVLIVRVMRELDRPATVEEIHKRLDSDTRQEVVEYHLSTLRAFRILKLVSGGPDLRFQLVSEAEEAEIFSGSGAVGACGIEAHRAMRSTEYSNRGRR